MGKCSVLRATGTCSLYSGRCRRRFARRWPDQSGRGRGKGEYVEDFGEVVGHGEGLHAKAQVAGDGDAVFADHADESAAVDVEGIGLRSVSGNTEDGNGVGGPW